MNKKTRNRFLVALLVATILSAGVTYAVVRFYLTKNVGISVVLTGSPYEVKFSTDSAGTMETDPVITGTLYEGDPENPSLTFTSQKYYLVKAVSGQTFDCYYHLVNRSGLPTGAVFNAYFSLDGGATWTLWVDGGKVIFGVSRAFYAVRFSLGGLHTAVVGVDVEIGFEVDDGT